MSMARPGYAEEYPTSFTLEKMGKKEAPRMIKKKAEVLSSFLMSVFTRENMQNIPDVASLMLC